ncbi:SH3 domain-containing protein [Roseiarcaceae bacterium H3SJ34-1]|uniref:SH3 domain-containing protein n=1 Tax=Terripilifer ovatus TaxID=3032367 RepID=UPI003AB93C92|nr:SH3 domain-containing protein [Roseiarcaceae bacterium H3SJ34-1]
MAKVAASFVALVVSLFAASTAHAEIFNACGVKETKDGFVALRDKPSPSARLVTRMKAGEVLVIDKTRKGNGLVRSGKWFRAAHYPGEAMPNPGDPGFKDVKRGWVHTDLVDDCG